MLYIVATPIGNLQDITLRALDILRSVDCVLCEDTRTTRKLLNAHDISAKTESFSSFATEAKMEKIISLLREGMSFALVTDAGTPAISDPGEMLVARVREALGDSIVISPIPGPSALIAALSVCGIPGQEFTFLGFIPHKKGRETMFTRIATEDMKFAFYESPHRIMKTLATLAEKCPEKTLVVCRELTKTFEEVRSATAIEMLRHYTDNPSTVRGEFVCIIK
jgi:16S rRNA (cytidine1402-2'-O)-methyltransferase